MQAADETPRRLGAEGSSMQFLGRALVLMALFLGVTAISGCGGQNEKPVNRNLDRPMPPK
jgi:hypothetical protein